MKIEFSDIGAEEAARIYESYRLDNEPDSPRVPFAQLDAARQAAVVGRLKEMQKLVKADNEPVGFITLNDEGESVNFGFGLFSEFRGKGLMREIIKAAAGLFHSLYPGRLIKSSTRLDNIAAIRSLEAGGFVRSGTETRPPCGGYESPVEYAVFHLG